MNQEGNSTWRAIFSDYDTDSAGNRERLAFVYDERAVRFTGLAAEAGAPRKKTNTGDYLPNLDFWRSPFIVSFETGDFDFIMMAVHVRWGSSETQRAKELAMLADWVDQRVKERMGWDKDIIVVGDFNIDSLTGPLYGAVCGKGLRMPEALAKQEFGSDLKKKKRYDQILHYPQYTKAFSGFGGIVDFFIDEASIRTLYVDNPPDKQKFTYEMSDHLPLWVQLNTDTDAEKLDEIIAKGKARKAAATG